MGLDLVGFHLDMAVREFRALHYINRDLALQRMRADTWFVGSKGNRGTSGKWIVSVRATRGFSFIEVEVLYQVGKGGYSGGRLYKWKSMSWPIWRGPYDFYMGHRAFPVHPASWGQCWVHCQFKRTWQAPKQQKPPRRPGTFFR